MVARNPRNDPPEQDLLPPPLAAVVVSGARQTAAPLVSWQQSEEDKRLEVPGKGEFLSGTIGDWDQFSANEAKFNVRATYDENLYTTSLDVSNIDLAKRAAAERIAHEIESTVSSIQHISEKAGVTEPGRAPASALVLLLCGLPASGKSTFARALCDAHGRQGGGIAACVAADFDDVHHVDYDALACDAGGDDGAAAGAEDDAPLGPSDRAAWRAGRARALNVLRDALDRAADAGSSPLVILDDNFHLRSMRREVYRACQERIAQHPSRLAVGFATLHFATPPEACLRRNAARRGRARVPDDVVSRMATVLEPPDVTKACASFERFHVAINNAEDAFDEAAGGIEDCLRRARRHPITPKQEPSPEEAARSARQREETLQCQTQRADRLLRRLVGAVGRVDKTRSREANDARKEILATARAPAAGVERSDEAIAGRFARALLGADADDDGSSPDAPLHRAVQEALREFRDAGQTTEGIAAAVVRRHT